MCLLEMPDLPQAEQPCLPPTLRGLCETVSAKPFLLSKPPLHDHAQLQGAHYCLVSVLVIQDPFLLPRAFMASKKLKAAMPPVRVVTSQLTTHVPSGCIFGKLQL